MYLQDSVKLLFNHWKSTNLFFLRCVDTSQVNKSAVLMTLITYYTINDTFFRLKRDWISSAFFLFKTPLSSEELHCYTIVLQNRGGVDYDDEKSPFLKGDWLH